MPYGYQIVNGKAVPNPTDAEKIKNFFTMYLTGLSIKKAGTIAEIPLTPRTLKRILINPIYGGADPFYPPLIPTETSNQAIRTAQVRTHPSKKKARNIMPVDNEFIFVRSSSCTGSVQELFDRIIPVRAMRLP